MVVTIIEPVDEKNNGVIAGTDDAKKRKLYRRPTVRHGIIWHGVFSHYGAVFVFSFRRRRRVLSIPISMRVGARRHDDRQGPGDDNNENLEISFSRRRVPLLFSNNTLNRTYGIDVTILLHYNNNNKYYCT